MSAKDNEKYVLFLRKCPVSPTDVSGFSAYMFEQCIVIL